MRLLSLLFDPRGAIDRRAFWSGLIQLMLVSLAVFAGLARLDTEVATAALPAVGEAFAVGGVASCIYGAQAPDISLIAALFVIAARLYVTACLMLKRSRDAGQGAGALIAFGLAGLLVHVLTGLWASDLFGEGMAVIVPLAADLAITTVLGSGFTVWLGARGSVPAHRGRLNPRHDLQFT
jgi:uncharacterized membrane protein YhaH (DUF805 family)